MEPPTDELEAVSATVGRRAEVYDHHRVHRMVKLSVQAASQSDHLTRIEVAQEHRVLHPRPEPLEDYEDSIAHGIVRDVVADEVAISRSHDLTA